MSPISPADYRRYVNEQSTVHAVIVEMFNTGAPVAVDPVIWANLSDQARRTIQAAASATGAGVVSDLPRGEGHMGILAAAQNYDDDDGLTF